MHRTLALGVSAAEAAGHLDLLDEPLTALVADPRPFVRKAVCQRVKKPEQRRPEMIFPSLNVWKIDPQRALIARRC
ncbi:MAG: hypothetical protein IRZ31_16600 [Thermogemmatispora sp.]|uniref:hypothetical protein n=1 Tax=Thermogemmatispora sp. TaxID=1968838 RepID=UPI00262006A9|nr:hypothetical protein [Thermogemmatispora sp.]MBX5458513.1 hypothetical protein [Thermogemmatispora sp.]